MLRYRVSVTKARWRPDRSVDRGCSPARTAARAHRTSARRLSIQYAARLACAHLLAVADASAIVIPLRGQIASEVHPYVAAKNVITVVMIVVLGSVAVALGGVVNLAPVLRWFVVGQQPGPDQRQAAMRLVSRQSMILAATWAVSGVIFILLNLGGGAVLAVATLLAVVFGGTAAASIGLLLTHVLFAPSWRSLHRVLRAV